VVGGCRWGVASLPANTGRLACTAWKLARVLAELILAHNQCASVQQWHAAGMAAAMSVERTACSMPIASPSSSCLLPALSRSWRTLHQYDCLIVGFPTVLPCCTGELSRQPQVQAADS
jgi:hypothetical protein